ncbi:MAG: hypothetical protein Q9219_002106 [cf. Caloplaca sp. 3 TL-2023]
MCCRTTSTDVCRDDGLCDSGWDGNVWRDFCTDPTWQAPNCVKLCMNSQGKDGDGNTGGSVKVTPCQDGSYCCGVGSFADTCCSKGAGVFIAKNGQTTNINPSATVSQSSAAASSASSATRKTTATTATPLTTPSRAAAAADTASQVGSAPSAAVTKTVTKESSNNTGAIAGGVVAGVLGAAIIIAAVIWAVRRRRNRPMDEKHGWTSQKPPALYGEMEGSNARQELPAPVGHEMATERPIPRQHHAAELP